MAGVCKGIIKIPFDSLITSSRLKNDLLKLGFADKRLDSLIASQAFSVIRYRGVSPLYRIKAIDRTWYDYVKDNLSLRRRIILAYLVKKRHVEIIS